jgi:hypothetical protein
MPKLDLTITADVLSEEQKPELMRELGAALLHWEGAPDTEFFRSITWAHLHELPAEAIQTPDGVADPHAILDITIPSGALSDRRRAGIVEDASKLILDATSWGADAGVRVWGSDPRGAGWELGSGRPGWCASSSSARPPRPSVSRRDPERRSGRRRRRAGSGVRATHLRRKGMLEWRDAPDPKLEEDGQALVRPGSRHMLTSIRPSYRDGSPWGIPSRSATSASAR